MAEREYREVSYEIWEKMAPGWLRERDYMWDVSRAVGEWLVAKLEPKPGQTILELACGVGDTGFAAAGALGDDGRLIATDFSPRMLEAARTRAEELGLGNVEFRVMDAEKMDLGDDSVDGVLCRWGYMLMSDPAAAFAETRRVLRDGGRLCFELVTGAGFATPEIEEVEVVWRFGDADEFWSFLTEIAGGVALVIKELPASEQQAVRDLLRERSAAFASDGGYAFPGVAINVVAS